MSSPEDQPTGLLANETVGDNAAMSVSDLSGALKRTVESTFGHVRVRGEISGWKRAASGHCYFTLKDDRACIDAVLWKGTAGRLAFRPEDGAEVIATGKLTTYPGRSKYQVVVDALELAGEGALMALLDKRRRQLAAEGIFDAERKKAMPYLPRTIGVVTSPTGAVIRDILHRLEDRFPTHVVVWPVPVQGEGAADKIAAAIRGFDALDKGGAVPRPDLLIVARGGGSIEDLWAFNEEAVVRAAADCTIPLISAVGHETDTTLIDFASDKRAPTPTAAAEMAVPVRRELIAYVTEQGARAFQALSQRLDRRAERLAQARERWPSADSLLASPMQRLDDAQRRLGQGLRSRADEAGGRLASWAGRLDPLRLLSQPLERHDATIAQYASRMGQGLTARARRGEEQLARFADRLAPSLAGSIARAQSTLREWTGRLTSERLLAPRARAEEERVAALARQLALVDPRRSPRKGFVLVTDADNVELADAASARRAGLLKLHYPDDVLPVRPADAPVAEDGPRPARKVAKARPSPYRPPQPGLFDAPGDEE